MPNRLIDEWGPGTKVTVRTNFGKAVRQHELAAECSRPAAGKNFTLAYRCRRHARKFRHVDYGQVPEPRFRGTLAF